MSPVSESLLTTLLSGTSEVVSADELKQKLALGRPLRVKLGIDPTATDIHLGFTVVLRKLRQFQDAGHVAVLIIGDVTARVGDPTGRSATRPQLDAATIHANAKTYLEQVSGILDPDRLEVRYNSEWLESMNLGDLVSLMSRMTVAQMLERNDFANRYAAGSPISITEFLYPLLQGWDSVMVEADIELGGSDQLFNNLVGRRLQEQVGQVPQVVLTTPLLEGTDGVNKMSKSLNNAIGIRESPADQFGKTYSIPDELVTRYMELVTGWPREELVATFAQIASGELPMHTAKRRLARRVVDLFHGDGAGELAEAQYDEVFKAGAVPEDIPSAFVDPIIFSHGPIPLARLLAIVNLVPSNKEGARMLEQGGVRLNGDRINDVEYMIGEEDITGTVCQIGKRRWARLELLE
ncbi:MAG: tyrosine--tRNA ligase [Acidimicrobiia bacterium]